MADTIFAVATAPGKAGIAVIRVSGPNAVEILTTMTARPCPPRRACLRRLLDEDGSVLDRALVLRFEADASFTGEETVELQLHGSIAVQRAVVRRLERTGLCRLAAPGEFTRRALLNDRLDLTEVQGLADVIDAETEEQRRAAMRVLNGEMSARIQGWRAKVLRAAALLEAVIDFADEEVPVDVKPEVREILDVLVAEIAEERAGRDAAVSLREGFQVAILGRPNAGKSSFLNAICGAEIALVSEIPGTTRDAIETAVDLAGLKVRFVDTAGLRETDDLVEGMGIERARNRARQADLRLYLHEEHVPPNFDPPPGPEDLVLRTKSDLNGGEGISSRTGLGIASVLEMIGSRLSKRSREAGLVTRQRDADMLAEAQRRLEGLIGTSARDPEELVAAELRDISVVLGRILGAVDVEDVLDEVFRSFCLGK
jgi:tRNA modification GTPase